MAMAAASGGYPPTSTTSASSPISTTNAVGVELFVHSLGSDAEESQLWRLFGPIGAVLSVKVERKLLQQK